MFSKKIKGLIYFIVFYIAFFTAFYFLAGHELHFRASRNNVDMKQGDAVYTELSEGVVYEQNVTLRIDRLENIGLFFTNFFRANEGNLTIDVLNAYDGSVVLSKSVDVSTITADSAIELAAEAPIEGLYNVPLKIVVKADSEAGSALAPLVCSTDNAGGLYVNGELMQGSLCFSAKGEEYIFLGLHYWKIVAVFGVLLIAAFLLITYRTSLGKKDYLFGAFAAFKKYKFLIKQLVSRDFKTKYKRSFLGLLWSFLNPLFMMLIQYFVFSRLFKADITNYPAYLLIGIVSFNFFTEATGMTLTSIVSNAGLITKVYMPKYIYPVTRSLSSCVNLAISIVPMLIVCAITGVRFSKSVVLALIFLVFLFIFTLGIGLLLSASMVFFRDTQFLWGIVSMAWMYATPIFYPASILPDEFKFILNVNPLYYYINNMRTCIIGGISPEPLQYIICALFAFGSVGLGSLVFFKAQDRFILYL